MKPLVITNGTKATIYIFNPNDEYMGYKYLSIKRQERDRNNPATGSSQSLTINGDHWPWFTNWLKKEIQKDENTRTEPLSFTTRYHGTVYSYVRRDKHRLLHKVRLSGSHKKHQELSIPLDKWEDFEKWLHEVLKQKAGFTEQKDGREIPDEVKKQMGIF
jgi:hypothetical protein